ncbi:MAG: hypothetical protein IJP11_02130 [Oscillospiraceae bacterium]|nr:hypothetical protein [Oscillospiraceae bacterium]
MLKITSVCNAGVLIEYGQDSLLVDGIAQSYLGFTGLSDALYGQLQNREGIFSGLRGILFTHCHPDHYDALRFADIRKADPSLLSFVPDENTSSAGCIQCGPFSVYYTETPHMPHTFEQVRHFTLLICAGSQSVYIAADAMLDAELHRTILRGVQPDWIAVNPVYLTMKSTVDWLADSGARDILIYHVPADPNDATGMRKKAERSIARCKDVLPRLHLPAQFPSRYE